MLKAESLPVPDIAPYTLSLQVTLNQLALAPVVLAAVFTWNLVLQRHQHEVPQKIKRDLVPTMVTGTM